MQNQKERASAQGRYEGNPFLRLLELYVLDSIGHMKNLNRETLRGIEPKLQETYGIEGDWKHIIESVMEFGPEIRPHIRDLWDRNQEIAKHTGEELEPDLFARMFVDANFRNDGDNDA